MKKIGKKIEITAIVIGIMTLLLIYAIGWEQTKEIGKIIWQMTGGLIITLIKTSHNNIG